MSNLLELDQSIMIEYENIKRKQELYNNLYWAMRHYEGCDIQRPFTESLSEWGERVDEYKSELRKLGETEEDINSLRYIRDTSRIIDDNLRIHRLKHPDFIVQVEDMPLVSP